jgi:hypothetical protein
MSLRLELLQTRSAQGLKETALAFRQTANNNADGLPAQVPERFGGAHFRAVGNLAHKATGAGG